MPFTLPSLPYAPNALEPYLDEQTMKIHHGKHHQTYIDNLNKALENHPDWQNKDVEDILQSLDQFPEEIRTKIRNNGGGHYNHSRFWVLMKPQAEGTPVGELATAITNKFGSFEEFKKQFAEAAKNRFGSGWAWLIYNRSGELEIISTPNQDSPIMDGNKDILGLDVWEHAYYLKYQNKRPDYIEAWWNVVNWEQAEKYFQDAK